MTHRAKTDASGRYEILGAIYRGGMGEILLAKVRGSQGFARKVVLKGLLPRLVTDEVSRALFSREARLMARLDHPNVVRAFDVPMIEDQPYLAMEYVRGRNFHQVIQRAHTYDERVPPILASHVVAEALRGLHFAHSARNRKGERLNIVHRDVSPGNILLSYYGEVKVTDFGIAKMADSPSVTGPRSIRGKARYTAPEIVGGGEATVSSDVYAAAVVLAEGLIGEPLWEGNNISATLLSIASEPRAQTLERIFSKVPEVPGLGLVLARGLALDPHDRFGSAVAFAEALDEVVLASGGPVTPARLGGYVRRLFSDAVDVPDEERLSTAPTPVDVDTDPTVSPLAPDDVVQGRLTPPGRAAQGRRGSPPPPVFYDVGVEAQPPSYLSELISVPGQTDQESSTPIAEAYKPPPSTRRLLDQPPWVLVILGIVIGALTAIAGSLLALLTSS